MNRAWFVLWALVIWQIAAWTFAPAPPPPGLPAGDGKPFGTNEAIAVESRQLIRKSALEALDRPWSERCGEHRKMFISGLNYYYYHRQNQIERYAENHGKPGADYIAGQWLTADDMRIERLTQEAYAHGYIAASDFDGVASKLVSAVVKNERVTGDGCAD